MHDPKDSRHLPAAASDAPAWKRKLDEIWGDGAPYFEAIATIARGNVFYGVDPATGDAIRIQPSVYSMIKAYAELRDTAIGKPVQAVVRADAVHDEIPHALLEELLTEQEQAEVRRIAQRAALERSRGRRQRQPLIGRGITRTIDVTPLEEPERVRELDEVGAELEIGDPLESGETPEPPGETDDPGEG